MKILFLTVRVVLKVVSQFMFEKSCLNDNNESSYSLISHVILYIAILCVVTHQCPHASFSFSWDVIIKQLFKGNRLLTDPEQAW